MMMMSDDAIPISRLIAWLIYKEKISTTPSLDGGVGTPQRGGQEEGGLIKRRLKEPERTPGGVRGSETSFY